jgi:phage baseplate assembly protein V
MIGIVTASNPATGKVRVQFPDRDGVVSDWLPVMQKKTLRDKSFSMPDVGEHVVCMMDEHEEFGVVLGAIYSDADNTPVSSQDKWHHTFDDGTTIEYDRAAHKLSAHVQGDIEVTATGTMTATIEGETTITTPKLTVNGDMLVNGNLDTGTGSNGGSVRMLGPVEVTNDVTAGGISLIEHVHSDPQGGTTGPPS